MSAKKIIGVVFLILALAGLARAIPDTLRHDYPISFTIGRFTVPALFAMAGVGLLLRRTKP